MDLNYHPQMTFTFSSRDSSNQYLKVGYYGDAQRYPFTDAGRPGISISPLGFCSDQTGLRGPGAGVERSGDYQDLDHLPAVLQQRPAR